MIAKTLKKLRENSGFTQKQVADSINVERSTYAYYETGKTTPDIDTILKLAKIFNVPYTDILNEELDKKSTSFQDIINKNNEKLNKNENIYELNKEEKTLLCFYRALSNKEKEEFLTKLAEQFNEKLTNKKRKD